MGQWSRNLPLLDRLRATWIETIYHEQGVGFLAQEASTEHREVNANVDGNEAATLIERMQQYLHHDAGCGANDLDYLDKAPCTCGLREIYNPKGARDCRTQEKGEEV